MIQRQHNIVYCMFVFEYQNKTILQNIVNFELKKKLFLEIQLKLKVFIRNLYLDL